LNSNHEVKIYWIGKFDLNSQLEIKAINEQTREFFTVSIPKLHAEQILKSFNYDFNHLIDKMNICQNRLIITAPEIV